MKITTKQYKKIKNDGELKKSKKKLKVWFNLYIRLSGFTLVKETGAIEGVCIACGKRLSLERFSDGSILNGRNFHASHYFDADKYPNIEFCEDNLWLSCARCNSPYGLHGNKPDYKENLLKKIGQERFDKLILAKNTKNQAGILEIDRMTFEYRDKSKAEAKRLGVKI